jgi:cell division protein ZapD
MEVMQNKNLSDTSASYLLYEHPLNELIRVCLRLEYLLEQTEYYAQKTNYFDSRTAIINLVELMSLLDRPDFRTKLTTELLRYRETIQKLEDKFLEHHDILGERLNHLNEDIAYLEGTYGKFAQSLRDNEFLSNLRFALARPGGAWNFDMPLYHYWLAKEAALRVEDIHKWCSEFTGLKKIIFNMLKLLRDWTVPELQIAENGFYQKTLDPKLTYQLIQLWIPKTENVIPEISVGKHRLSLRFLEVDYDKRPQQTKKSIEFKMTQIVCTLPSGA